MNIQEPQSKPIESTLADLLKSGNDNNLRPYQVLIGHNMGFTTLLMSVPIDKFYDISEVANERTFEEKRLYEGQQVAQRELDLKHAERLATYLLKGLFASVAAKSELRKEELTEEFYTMQEALGSQSYLALQPLTANIRNCEFGGVGLRVEKSADGTVTVYLAPSHVLWIVDGQHRREAMRFVFEFLKDVTTTLKYPRRAIYTGSDSGEPVTSTELQVWNQILEAWRSGCTVMAEVHLGLKAEQEQQLFHDLNNLTKKVAASLAFSFDNGNPINVFIKTTLIEADGALFKDKIVERDNTPWSDDKGVISRKDLIAVNSMLFLNKANARGATPQDVNDNKEYALHFWAAVGKIREFGTNQAKLKTVAAQPVFLKSLAKLAYTFALGRARDNQALNSLLAGIPQLDLTHTNPMWRYNRLSEQDRESLCPGLASYLPQGFDEIGSFDEVEKHFRFSPLHNDIMPTIGDMIRWALRLPNRHNV
jgi:DNA-sulfur modification-associated